MFVRSIDGLHEVLQRYNVRFYSPDEYGLSIVSLADTSDLVAPLTTVIKFSAEQLAFGSRMIGDESFQSVSFADYGLNGCFTFTFECDEERKQFCEFYGLDA